MKDVWSSHISLCKTHEAGLCILSESIQEHWVYVDSQFREFQRKEWIFLIKITGEQIMPPFLNVLAADLKDKNILQPSNSPPSQMKMSADRKGSISTLEQILGQRKMS